MDFYEGLEKLMGEWEHGWWKYYYNQEYSSSGYVNW